VAAVQLRQHPPQTGARVVFVLDSLFIGGLRFVLDKIVAAADAELRDDSALREELLEAQMRRELGEIDETEFKAVEADLLSRIREIKARQGAITMSPHDKVVGVDIETFESKG
jgi:gas vesicle protein GvpG